MLRLLKVKTGWSLCSSGQKKPFFGAIVNVDGFNEHFLKMILSLTEHD
jgi:hypothetical protein